jgi:hypothetical protein
MAKQTKALVETVVETPVVEQTAAPVVVAPNEINYDYGKLLEEHKSKSGIIRFLASKEFSRGQIAKFMGIKYQFVRNVLITPVKKTS